VAGFSQAAPIFSGLEYSRWIGPLHPTALRPALGPGRRFVFVHFWDTHTPYGAADARALGTTAQLLNQGRRQEVIAGYQAAVERVFEHQVAPLLEGLALEEWMVVILGDHGESWTDEEPYHGQTLNNSVLRVPLYLHLPYSGNPLLPGAVHSLVDVFATVDHLFGLRSGYRGYGRDLRTLSRPTPYLAELDPGPVVPAAGAEPGILVGRPNPGPQWALFDAARKFTFWERSGACRLEDTFSGQILEMDAGGVEGYRSAYRTLVAASAYAALPPAGTEPDTLVDQRLRELGYL
ncbi:MAG: sulfatase-like hydrolase/transferase, partial [Candidatus Latescibacteria bacterium]|nr:sulfatase-like hydrolase/transferase [Candidatus Latescibacterota bacterium]